MKNAPNAEDLFARQICQGLDRATRELDSGVAERLRAARERALSRQAVTAEATAIVGAGGTAALHPGGGHSLRTALSILALLLGVLFAYTWNALDEADANEEIDSALLTDELPPNAYLDKGFHAWLEKTARASE